MDLALPGHEKRGARPAGRRQRVQRRGQVSGAAGDGPHREPGLGPLHRLARGKPGQHPVDGPDLRRERVAVHQQREPVVPGPRPVARAPPVGLDLQVRRVAVVPVRDQGLPGREVGGDRRERGRIGDRPQACAGCRRRCRCSSTGVPAAATWPATRVAALSWPPSYSRKIGSRLAWVASISCRRPRTGPGMTSSCGSTMRAPGGASRTAPIRPRCSTRSAPAGGRDQPLLVHVQGGLVPGDQDAVALPVGQQPGGVVVLLARPARVLAGEDQPDHVMRIRIPQLLGGVLADDVVRWRGDLRESAHPFRGITDTTERRELEPGWSRRLFPAGRKDLHI